jgi:hypothetical protein
MQNLLDADDFNLTKPAVLKLKASPQHHQHPLFCF